MNNYFDRLLKNTLDFPKKIILVLLLLSILVVGGVGWLSFILISILVGYNITNTATLIVALSLSLIVLTYFLILKNVYNRKKTAFIFLRVVGLVNFPLVLLGILPVFWITSRFYTYSGELASETELFSLQRFVGLSIFSLVNFIPSLTAFLSNSEKKFFRGSSNNQPMIIISAFFVTISNTFWMGFFTYLLLVLLFPEVFGLNT